jgi:hypothetical protein
MNRERNRPGSGRSDDQSPSTPRPGYSEGQREEEEEEESGNRIEEDEESSPMGQQDRDRESNRGSPGNQGRQGMDD